MTKSPGSYDGKKYGRAMGISKITVTPANPRKGALRAKLNRTAKPLPIPAFGTPAGGKQCAQCKRWFAWNHFERANNRRVLKCRDCLEGPAGLKRRQRSSEKRRRKKQREAIREQVAERRVRAMERDFDARLARSD